MDGLRIEERRVNGVVILNLSGKVTLNEGTKQMRMAVRNIIFGGEENILLNFNEVTYVDNSLIKELVSSSTTVSMEGGNLKLLNLTNQLQNLLSITKLLTVFDIFENEKEAIASYENPKSTHNSM